MRLVLSLLKVVYPSDCFGCAEPPSHPEEKSHLVQGDDPPNRGVHFVSDSFVAGCLPLSSPGVWAYGCVWYAPKRRVESGECWPHGMGWGRPSSAACWEKSEAGISTRASLKVGHA